MGCCSVVVVVVVVTWLLRLWLLWCVYYVLLILFANLFQWSNFNVRFLFTSKFFLACCAFRQSVCILLSVFYRLYYCVFTMNLLWIYCVVTVSVFASALCRSCFPFALLSPSSSVAVGVVFWASGHGATAGQLIRHGLTPSWLTRTFYYSFLLSHVAESVAEPVAESVSVGFGLSLDRCLTLLTLRGEPDS